MKTIKTKQNQVVWASEWRVGSYERDKSGRYKIKTAKAHLTKKQQELLEQACESARCSIEQNHELVTINKIQLLCE